MKVIYAIVLSTLFLMLVSCDKVDSCLDSGGCWDKVDNVCRKSEPNAQELCDRKTSFSPKPWLEDYLALREHISKSYANLEYLIKYYKSEMKREAAELKRMQEAKAEAEQQLQEASVVFPDKPREASEQRYSFPGLGQFPENGRNLQFMVVWNDKGMCYNAYSGDQKPARVMSSL